MSKYNETRKTLIQAMMLGNMATLKHISSSEEYPKLDRVVALDLLEEYDDVYIKRYGMDDNFIKEFGDYVGNIDVLQEQSN